MTKQRKLVMDIIENSCCHPTAEQVFLKAKEQISGIAMATVYNNINYLLDEGLIRRISVIGQADRFDNVRIPHEHIKCDKCNKITDIFLGDMLDELVREREDTGNLFMHGTGILLNESGILLLGNSGSGKTTLAVEMISVDMEKRDLFQMIEFLGEMEKCNIFLYQLYLQVEQQKIIDI